MILAMKRHRGASREWISAARVVHSAQQIRYRAWLDNVVAGMNDDLTLSVNSPNSQDWVTNLDTRPTTSRICSQTLGPCCCSPNRTQYRSTTRCFWRTRATTCRNTSPAKPKPIGVNAQTRFTTQGIACWETGDLPRRPDVRPCPVMPSGSFFVRSAASGTLKSSRVKQDHSRHQRSAQTPKMKQDHSRRQGIAQKRKKRFAKASGAWHRRSAFDRDRSQQVRTTPRNKP